MSEKITVATPLKIQEKIDTLSESLKNKKLTGKDRTELQAQHAAALREAKGFGDRTLSKAESTAFNKNRTEALKPETARAINYPSIGDQLDVIWKQIAGMPKEALKPETKAMLDQILAVKKKFPKG